MKILFSPQRSINKIAYKIVGDVITATYNNKASDAFDFAELPDGELDATKTETNLPINPIVSAKRENGELSVVLLNFVGENATEQELFPHWQVIN